MEPHDLAAALERIAVGSVGVTSRALTDARPTLDMTFPQWRAVVVLGSTPEGARVGEVAARVGVTLPATGRLLRRLERRGLIELTPDASDRRARRATLTAAGTAVRDAIVASRRGMLLEVGTAVAARGSLDLERGLDAIAAGLEHYA
jgi:DNA-binding MarR family transcriptional regulator